MLVYKYQEILGRLREMGWSTTRIRREKLLSESTLARLRSNQTTSTDTIDVLCTLLHCQPNDILEIRYDEELRELERTKSAERDDEESDPPSLS